MLQISGSDAGQIDPSALTPVEREVLQGKQSSPVVYQYDSMNALRFELRLRDRTVNAAKMLQNSRADFAVFRNSRCNPQFWTRTDNGGFQMNPGVQPSDAINDIFQNGELYGFECATAIVIVLYKAVLDTIGAQMFNSLFNPLYLRDWNHDSDLWFITTQNKNESYPGDVMYFRNPDHDRDTPEWQGENVVKLSEDLFFGHGIGIETSEEIINALNKMREPFSTQSAYLDDLVVHPNFKHLQQIAATGRRYPVGV
ncbi:protein-glutamine gamma-glutamyltransferase [Paenibacillus glycanilyticus]|uniref:Protein-glutamine gamma-glutamyltransferase n=1 Tax=Paenibacillus glycanilyticus TaxID=126569 RepID=A0ABQ6G8K6_9BACL|nr:protein-glutamine gamma-glutamyltransferase [Paenibacillus glycanilyticus]GLX67299.1 protein-glutamine gamma-glutamyltransferase [Paenibacillus glycanilyticus]